MDSPTGIRNKGNFVIGVCGHKDIVTPKEEVLRALDAFWVRVSAEHAPPPLLLDSLAEGGDQIVLESKPQDVHYLAVLPFASAEYEKDFETPEAKRIYRAYLAVAAAVVVAGDRPGAFARWVDRKRVKIPAVRHHRLPESLPPPLLNNRFSPGVSSAIQTQYSAHVMPRYSCSGSLESPSCHAST